MTIASERIYEGRLVGLRVDTVRLPQGRVARREFGGEVERSSVPWFYRLEAIAALRREEGSRYEAAGLQI